MEALALGAGVAAAAGAAWILAPYAVRKRGEAALAAQARAQRAIALTYDDGPGDQVTPALLDLLKANNAHATFFLLGERIAAARALAERVAAEGHEIGSHSAQHLHPWTSLPWAVNADIVAGLAATRSLQPDAALFRPPFGKMTLAGLWAARRTQLAWWTIDSQDSWARRPQADVMAEIAAKGGGVVLLHDGDGYKQDGHRDYVLDLTARIIAFARAENYRLATLGALLRESRA